MQGLTGRQQMVLDYIRQSIEDRGYPPTLREIGARMGIRSTNGVNDHLRALERKGYLTREDMKSRALRPTALAVANAASSAGIGGGMSAGADFRDSAAHETSFDQPELPGFASVVGRIGSVARDGSTAERNAAPKGAFGEEPSLYGSTVAEVANDADMIEIPIVGRVAAGLPLLADEHVIDTVKIDRGLVRGGREVFGLRVHGDSMIEAGIHSGDYIFVKKQLTAQKGDIVVALIGDEATVKYYFPEKDHVRFQPANRTMAPIYVRAIDFRPTMLLGVVVGLFRRM